MKRWLEVCPARRTVLIAVLFAAIVRTASAATIEVPAGGNLQAAIDAAIPGDTILLAPGATYIGNFVLPLHGGTTYITIRTGASDDLLPPVGVRMSPAYAPYLAKIKSPTGMAAVRTAPGAAFWRLQYLEFLPTLKSQNDIIALGDGSSAQNTLEKMPHHLILDRLYVHGDPLTGQKRGIALNSGDTSIVSSYVSDIKAAGQDTQAVGGWNGSGPYYIANNYFEATGNGVMIGGDDPKIPNLTPTDIVFRGNTISRPLSWRDVIVPTPTNVRASISADGSLVAGTYGYRVMARRNLGTSTANSTPALEVTATVAVGARISLTWSPVADATDYVVYGRTPGAQTRYWLVTGTAFSDNGVSAGSAGTPPSSGTVWTVKNLFELKNARHVQVDYNIMENNWAQAQTGYAVLLTPRNQYGSCTWCVVEDITFEHNIVRHTGGGISLTGLDDEHVSQQTNRIRIRHNEFSDYTKAWGTGYFLAIANDPRDVVVDHNTLISGQGAGVILASGNPMYGFVFTNNLARHDTYGILGNAKGYGNPAIGYYFPDGVVTRNVLAGGVASNYPAGNEFPTVASFISHFVSYTGADYSLVPGTDWAGAGTDALDLGADMDALHGMHTEAVAEPPSILTTVLPEAMVGDAYLATLEAQGGRPPYRWSVVDGALQSGLQLDSLTGEVLGVPVQEGDSVMTVQLEDAAGATARQPLGLYVDKAIPPVAMLTVVLSSPTATIPFAQALEATGGLGTYTWSAGVLPQGISLSGDGVLAGTATAPGAFPLTITVADAQDVSRFATASFTLVVAPKPNVAPTVSLTASTVTTPALASTVTFTAVPFDADGFIQRVDLYVDGAVTASAIAAPFTFTWTAVAGDHRISALAVDDAGATTMSSAIVLTTKLEVVLHARDVTTMVGAYQQDSDPTAADRVALWNQNRNAAKLTMPFAAPKSYVEFQFYAEAGRPYHLWIRSRAQKNDFANDSAYVQFSNVPSARIGTTAAMTYQLEDAAGSGLSGWGWQDNGLGTAVGMMGANIVFEKGGLQTLRVQPREDGLSIDQIVISPDRYLLFAPGTLKDDATIVAR
jgi:hypothetical protein